MNKEDWKKYKKYYNIELRYYLRRIQRKFNNVFLPGLRGQSLYSVGVLFVKGMQKGFIADRAAAVAFNIFTSLFPMLLIAFTIIPYVPFPNFQEELLGLIRSFLPEALWSVLETTITYIVTQKSGNWLSIGIVSSLYLSSNGIDSLLRSFSRTYHDQFGRFNGFQRRLMSFLVMIVFVLLLLFAITIRVSDKYVVNYIVSKHVDLSNFLIFCVHAVNYLMSVFMMLLAVSTLYRAAMKERRGVPIFTIGGTIATILLILTSYLFQIYIENFSLYNVLYGSLGTVLLLNAYLYLNSMFLIVGFDINASVYAAWKTSNQMNCNK